MPRVRAPHTPVVRRRALPAHTKTARTPVAHVATAETAPLPSGVDALRRLTSGLASDDGRPHASSLLELRAHAEHDALDVVFQKHMVDFRTAFAGMRKQPPSIVFFGGARLKPGDKHYALAERFGAACAEWGIPPKTGRGPGAMHAVPASFIEARDAHAIKVVQTVVDGVSRLANLEDHRTLGFNIKLPKEQAPSPSIENGGEIQNFAFRKFALYENVRGVVVLPGGFGTLDELLEVLVLKENGRSQDPVVLAGADFWQPLLATWRAQAGARGIGAQLDKLLANVLVTDDPERALLHIQASPDVKSFDEDPDHLFKHMVREIKRAQHVVLNQATAVAVLGGNALAANDPALATLRAVATGIDAPLRVGEEGQVLDALVSAGAEHVQRVLWQKNGDDRVHGRIDVDNVSFDERVPHKEALLRNASAYLVLPDCGRGQDEFSSVLCQIQTGKLPRRPIVLVDSAYWQPIVESWKSRMIGDGHAYIAPEDVALISYANDGAQALAALTS